MIRIAFVCHGNICRSPAAEFIFKNVVSKLNREHEFEVFSCATSLEEIGNDIYPPMKEALKRNGVPFSNRRARRFTKNDYENSDYIFYMDSNNYYNLLRLQEDKDNKYYPLYKWTTSVTRIEDPWYTGNYDKVINDITKCIIDILKNI